MVDSYFKKNVVLIPKDKPNDVNLKPPGRAKYTFMAYLVLKTALEFIKHRHLRTFETRRNWLQVCLLE